MAKSKQVLLVLAAGNDPVKNDDQWLPSLKSGASAEKIAAYNALVQDYQNYVLVVGGLDTSRQRAQFYVEGSVVELYAPSVNVGSIINTVCARASYNQFVNCGTSFAAPQVTGAAALVAANGTFTASQVKQRLLDFACQVGGTKILNASRAVHTPQLDNVGNPLQPYLAYVSGVDFGIHVLDRQGGDRLLVGPPSTNESYAGITWSPDGRQLAYEQDIVTILKDGTRQVDSHIYWVNADGTNLSQVIGGHVPSWSPDGQRIAYLSVTDGGIHVLDLLGGDRLLVGPPSGGAFGFTPSWFPDGRQVAYVKTSLSASNSASIFRVNADGTGAQQVTDGFAPSWSSNGQKIAYVALTPDNGIHILDFQGGDTLIVNGNGGPLYPTWSPDGRQLAYSLSISFGIYRVNADGTGVQQVAKGIFPSWSPCFAP